MIRRVSSATGPLPLRTLETVATDTFASRATSLIVTILLAGVCPARQMWNQAGAKKTAELLADLCQERLQYVIVYIEGARPSSDLPVIRLPPFPRSGSRSNF